MRIFSRDGNEPCFVKFHNHIKVKYRCEIGLQTQKSSFGAFSVIVDCETSNFAKVHFQLQYSVCAIDEVMLCSVQEVQGPLK